MQHPSTTPGVRTLPPLILHPFSDAQSPERLSMSARASLILHGLLPPGEASEEELIRRALDGRYCEVKMLFYLGKDLVRWLEQCMELAAREPELAGAGLEAQSFAELLVEDTPEAVSGKLRQWGVTDYQAIFRRALGVHAMFCTVPEREQLGDAFLRQHHLYTDTLFATWLQSVSHARAGREAFHFEIYASGEYARLLEREWGGQ
jgi:hypothetical protein